MTANALLSKTHMPGTEQGIDVKRQTGVLCHLHRQLRSRVRITVVDYSAQQVSLHHDIFNDGLAAFLSAPRPAWSKVRWINLQGMSWDCISVLALHFDLHPLAVEDCIHIPQRIKADFYGHDFVYCSLTLASVVGAHHEAQPDSPRASASRTAGSGGQVPRPAGAGGSMPSYSKSPLAASAGSVAWRDDGPPPAYRLLRRHLGRTEGSALARLGVTGHLDSPRCSTPSSAKGQHKRIGGRKDRGGGGMAPQAASQPAAPSSGTVGLLDIAGEQVSLFLMKDGTVISMFENDGSSVIQPILHQVSEARTLARESEDASYLLNLLIDAVVDMAYPVVDAYTELLHSFEDKVMKGQPAAAITRELHVMQGDLAVFRRTVLPTYNVVAALRGHVEEGQTRLVSKLTSTYLNDVQDHVSTILENMDGLQGQARDLIDLVFNLIAHNTNKSMQTLSIMSTIFLPLSFLAGVYGANFDSIPEIHWEYGYVYFWCMCGLITMLFMGILWRLGMLNNGN